MTNSFDLERSFAVAAGRGTLKYRSPQSLPFDVRAVKKGAPVLLDSSVYVDGIRGNLPADLNDEIGQRALVHSSVVAAELAWAIGALDPLHPQTPRNRESIEQVIRRMMAGDTVAPDAADWIDAALLAATLSRRQTFDKDHRRKALNDALIFYQARQAGAVLVTRNIKDFDLMDQIVPGTQMLFYERAAA